MYKFTLLLVVLCVVALVAAEPAKKNGKLHKHHKSAKLVAKPFKGHRRSSKYEVIAEGSSSAGFEDIADVVEQVFPENDEEAKLFDEEVAFDEVAVEEELVPRFADESVEESGEQAPAHNPAGNYFSTHFGKVNGGAIGLANSYSTGKSGQSTSHSTAYGQAAPAHHAQQFERLRAHRRH